MKKGKKPEPWRTAFTLVRRALSILQRESEMPGVSIPPEDIVRIEEVIVDLQETIVDLERSTDERFYMN